MDPFLQGVLGGIVPTVIMVVVYLVAVSGRLAEIETNIKWIIKTIEKCLPPSKTPSH